MSQTLQYIHEEQIFFAVFLFYQEMCLFPGVVLTYLSVCANREAILSGIQAVHGDLNCQGKILPMLHNASKIWCTLYFTLG